MSKYDYQNSYNKVCKILDDGEDVEVNLTNLVVEKADKEQHKKVNYVIKKQNEQYLHNQLGNFYLYFYEVAKDLEPQYLFRFIYLCTFMNYDGYLITGETKGTKKVIEKDLQKLLRLSERETRNTKNVLRDLGLLEIDDNGNIKINSSVAKKGAIKGIKKDDFSRVFIDGVRDLYENHKPIEHKRLGLFIKMLPYVNYHHNVLCSLDTVQEREVVNINPLTFEEIAELIGYSTRQIKRFQQDLLSIRVMGKCVVLIAMRGNKTTVSINPCIYYKGNNIDDLKALINLFSM